MALTCGTGGSTGLEIVTQINDNETAIVDLDNRVDSLETKISTNRFFGEKISAYAIPNDYTGGDAISLTTPPVPAGRYLISYAAQLSFGAVKDKEIAYQMTGDFAGNELAQAQTINSTVGKKATNYSFYRDLPDGVVSFGMQFRDVSQNNGFTLDFCDVMLLWVGETI